MNWSIFFQGDKRTQQVGNALRVHLLAMQPEDIEELISPSQVEMDFDTFKVTQLRGDGSINVQGNLVERDLVRIRKSVQVKKWKNHIQAQIVQQVRGILEAHEQGPFITTSNFNRGLVKGAAGVSKSSIAFINDE